MNERVTMSTSSWEPQPGGPPPVQPNGLGLVSVLFKRLNEADITYCHWKSNEHLGAAVAGLTDLDVLVDRRHGVALQRILSACGFKRFAAPLLRAYPAIEDYIGLDHDTGRLAHLHLHYELTLGERHLKGYRLPWETRILKTCRLNPEYGVYVTEPTIELLLLLVRAALKERARDRLYRIFSSRPSGTADFEREFAWLRRQIDDAVMRETAGSLLGPQVDQPLLGLLAAPPAGNDLATFSAALRPMLRWTRTYGRTRGAAAHLDARVARVRRCDQPPLPASSDSTPTRLAARGYGCCARGAGRLWQVHACPDASELARLETGRDAYLFWQRRWDGCVLQGTLAARSPRPATTSRRYRVSPAICA